jgi:hypothetical protein
MELRGLLRMERTFKSECQNWKKGQLIETLLKQLLKVDSYITVMSNAGVNVTTASDNITESEIPVAKMCVHKMQWL